VAHAQPRQFRTIPGARFVTVINWPENPARMSCADVAVDQVIQINDADSCF